jgi:hypothetical protein
VQLADPVDGSTAMSITPAPDTPADAQWVVRDSAGASIGLFDSETTSVTWKLDDLIAAQRVTVAAVNAAGASEAVASNTVISPQAPPTTTQPTPTTLAPPATTPTVSVTSIATTTPATAEPADVAGRTQSPQSGSLPNTGGSLSPLVLAAALIVLGLGLLASQGAVTSRGRGGFTVVTTNALGHQERRRHRSR